MYIKRAWSNFIVRWGKNFSILEKNYKWPDFKNKARAGWAGMAQYMLLKYWTWSTYQLTEHPFLHLEDVFLTGIIAEQVGVPRRLAVEFRNNAVRIPAKFLGCTLLRTISIHKVLPSEQEELAKMAKNPQCGKNTGLNKVQKN